MKQLSILIIAMLLLGCNEAGEETPGADATREGGGSTVASQTPDNQPPAEAPLPTGQSEVADTVQVTAADAAEIVRDGIDEFYSGICSDDESTRIETFDKFMMRQDHLTRLFGEADGRQLWSLVESHLSTMRQDTARLKQELSRGGAVVEIRPINVRREDRTGRYVAVLAAIPADIHVFRAIVRYENTSAGSSSYLVIDGKMVIVRELEVMYDHLRSQG